MFHGSSQVELLPSPGSCKNLPTEPKPNNKSSLTSSQWDVPQFHCPWCRTYTLACLAASVFLVVFIWWALSNIRGWNKWDYSLLSGALRNVLQISKKRKRKRPSFVVFINEYGVNNPTMVNFKIPTWFNWTQSGENGHIMSWESIQVDFSIPSPLPTFLRQVHFPPIEFFRICSFMQ